MRKKTCHFESEVIDGLKKEKLNTEIKKHISECPICEDIVFVHRWMSQFKNRSLNAEILEKTLPDAETIWNRAQAGRADNELVKKALRPLIYPRIFSYGFLIIGVVILFLSSIKKIGNVIDSHSGAGPVLDSLSKIIAQFFPFFLIPMVIVIISMLFCVFVAAFERRKKTV
jgi:hypothetical protein